MSVYYPSVIESFLVSYFTVYNRRHLFQKLSLHVSLYSSYNFVFVIVNSSVRVSR